MPRRDEFQKVMIIGSGPIIIGQACEFDSCLAVAGDDPIAVPSAPARSVAEEWALVLAV